MLNIFKTFLISFICMTLMPVSQCPIFSIACGAIAGGLLGDYINSRRAEAAEPSAPLLSFTGNAQ